MIVTNEPLDELGARLTGTERADLESCRYQMTPERSPNVLELVAAWALHVRKIDADRTRPPDDPRTWGPHDLVAALYIRDFLADCLSRLPAALSDKVIAAVHPHDELFQAVTQDDYGQFVARVADLDVTGRPWWWHLIPDSGPMLDELRALS
jgi:hypothetical protein